jgi:peptidoglycan/LPS O-acetylase OafA/YrhL
MPENLESSNSRVPELDGLRAVAVLLVVAYHYLEPFHRKASGWQAAALAPARMGWIGVDLFFVLSGYLIASILLANRPSPAFFSTFYIRRFCRILPLYVPVVFVLYLAHQRIASSPQPPLYQYLTFTHNFWMASAGNFGNSLLAVTWSLAIEEQFYLFLPALIRFNRPRRLIAIVIACIGLAVFLRYCFLSVSGRDAFFAIQVLFPTRLDSLMLGVLAAFALFRGIRIPAGILWVLWIAGGSWILTAVIYAVSGSQRHGSFLWSAIGPSAIASFCLGTLLLALRGRFPFLRWRALTYTGWISYGLYLLHQPVLSLVSTLLPLGRMLLPIVALAVTYVAAALSWELFEKRFVRLGHRFQYRPETTHRSRLKPSSRG